MSRELELARTIARTWIVVVGLFYCYDILRDTGGSLNSHGRPLGDDYVNFWSGPYLAWHGRLADVYNWPVYHAFQQSIVGGSVALYLYVYPPVLLILTAPLALIPYLPGLAAWLIAGWLCFWRALRLALPGRDALLLALAAPAVFVNAYGGQNGTWSAALFGGGLCLISRHPFVAGILFGLMVYKPQLALLIPVALLAGRQWWTIAGAAVSAGTLVLASVLAFGPELWRDYLQFGTLVRQTVLEQGASGWHRLVSVFALARLLGADVQLAYVVQAGAALIAAVVVALAWLRDVPASIRYASLVLGTCLATPYVQDYDLVVGAFVVVWLTRPESLAYYSERAALIASAMVLIVPLASSFLTHATGFVSGPLFLLPAFVLVARAVFAELAAMRTTAIASDA
jgi:arabinofuranan 3-O-arabinosyltransferase